MLDLEKKMESKTDEIQTDIRKDLARILDDRDLKEEIVSLVEDKIENVEFNFSTKVVSRIELLEKAYDQAMKSINIIEGKFDIENQKSMKIEDTLRD